MDVVRKELLTTNCKWKQKTSQKIHDNPTPLCRGGEKVRVSAIIRGGGARTSDGRQPQTDLLTEEDLLGGILDEFYSCPACGQTAIPNEEMFTQRTLNVSAWNLAVATELF